MNIAFNISNTIFTIFNVRTDFKAITKVILYQLLKLLHSCCFYFQLFFAMCLRTRAFYVFIRYSLKLMTSWLYFYAAFYIHVFDR